MSKVFALLLALLALSTAPSPVYGASSVTRACAEDDPCFSWSTMGNRTRGVLLTLGAYVPPRYVRAVYASPTGTRVVVAPCAFARMMRAGMIRYPRAERMRGDTFAILRGCR